MEEDKAKLEVKPEEIRGLLEYFSKNTYKARDTHPKVQQVMQRCLGLFGLDYNFSVIANTLGELSTNYPSNLVILESEKGQDSELLELNSTTNNTTNSVVNGNGIDIFGNGNNGLFENHLDLDMEFGRDNNKSPPRGIDLLLESESFIGTSLPSYYSATSTSNGNGNVGNGNSTSFVVTGNKTTTTTSSSSTNSTNNNVLGEGGVGLEASKLKELCSRARFARCRARFPVSVMLYNNTHICRSATLSGGPEIYGRSSFDYFFSGGADSKQYNDPEPGVDDEIVVPETQSDWQLFDRVRSQDIRLLKSFQVQTIVDLMVEKKKVKFGVNVTSSEKVDKENRYAEFNLISLPYPGCEFFKDYRDKGYNAEDLVFEWNQGHVDANIFVPTDMLTKSLNTDWTEYRKWDLVTLTQKYLKLLLAYVRSGNNGLLVHCISGWDRTPLFISLLRLSLWADGAIHKSLSAEQILYLTLAYDWLLFGHNLEDRLSKGEEILFFCFYFLKFMVDEEFCIEDSPLLQPNSNLVVTTMKETQLPLLPTKNVDSSSSSSLRVRNDSDIQLDGVLLEGDGCHTSPEGSNWSLSSVESSQSNKSQDNPPAYFQIPQDSSWEDCKGIQHLVARQRHHSSNSNNSKNHNQIAQMDNYNHFTSNSSSSANNGITSRSVVVNNGTIQGTNGEISVKTFEPAAAASAITTTTLENPIAQMGLGVEIENRACSISSINSNGISSSSLSPSSLSSGVGRTTNLSSSNSSSFCRQSPLSLPSSSSSLSSNPDTESGCFHTESGTAITKVERTNPVAVPGPKRVHHHHHHRPESASSASIGSWQLIAGPGSMREAISSSDPGSSSSYSHSHPSRIPINGAPPECIEASESSCTLVDQLTPVNIIDSVESLGKSLTESVIAVPEPICSLGIDDEINDPLRAAAAEISEAEWKLFSNNRGITPPPNNTNSKNNSEGMEMENSIFVSQLLSTSNSGGCGLGTPTNVTPTKEKESSDTALISGRREKLQTVRAHFYTLYASAIGFKFRSVNDNGGSTSGGGGLGFLIGNLLGSSKIGNRTTNRTTNL